MNWNPALLSHQYARPLIYGLLATVIIFFIIDQRSNARSNTSSSNGFDLSNSLVPADEIHHGGPRRDGISAIDKPKFISPAQADFLKPEHRILGLSRHGISKAYPVQILNYHEIVNDKLGTEPVVITYCPLCGTGMAFSSRVKNTHYSFGVSGLLYNSDMLLYDRQTESLWSQIMKQAIAGPNIGTLLRQLPLTHTSWSDWQRRHPDTRVLSTETGYQRDYARSPYPGYETSSDVFFPVSSISRQYHAKEWVIGIEINNQYKVYPFAELAKLKSTNLQDQFANTRLQVIFDPLNRTGKILDQNGTELPSVTGFWFAWISFHPESLVYKAVLDAKK